jgi:hypothetical protein
MQTIHRIVVRVFTAPDMTTEGEPRLDIGH